MILFELNLENIEDLIDNKQVFELRTIFDYYNNVDLAKVISKLDDTKLLFIFKTMKTDIMAEVFSYLEYDSQEKIIDIFTSDEISAMLDYILTDDIVDFVSELPSNLVVKVLNATKNNKKAEVNRILNFKENTAGAILTAEYIELKAHNTCGEALEIVRKKALEVATTSYLYVIDNNRRLLGYLNLKDIVFGSSSDLIGNLMETDIISINVNDTQEEAVKIFKMYDLDALPVVNTDNCLTGIITIDDIIDVIDDEDTKDMQIMAAVTPLETLYLDSSVFVLAKSKIVWLLVIMLAGIFSSLIIAGFEEAMGILLPFLPIFIPMLMDVGGNAGSQTTTLIIRSLSLEEFSLKDFLKVIKKELSVALLSGISLGILGFIIVYCQKYLGIFNYDVPTILVASLLGISIFITVFIAKTLGVILPMLASKIKADPAVMAGPLVTSLIDTLALLIYYALAFLYVLPLMN